MIEDMIKVIEKNNEEWVLKAEAKMMVALITDAIRPAAGLKEKAKEVLGETHNKDLKKNVYDFVQWLWEYATSYQRWREESQRPRSQGRGDAPSPKLACVVESVLPLEATLFDSGSDTSVGSSGFVTALLAAGASVTMRDAGGPLELQPYGAGTPPVTVTKKVKLNSVEFQTSYGPLVLRGLDLLHHASRLKLYSEAERDVAEDRDEQVAFGDNGFHVEALEDIRDNAGRFEVKVKWLGLDEAEDSWEPTTALYEDIPVIFRRWTKSNPKLKFMSTMLADVEKVTGHPL
ncbi:hypothetical protein DYB32_009374 [Aphanomyces invadans]|uniref:Chromo domain-containing protein n=1 Tax=Aphanomyces invadans TaxID=157072 RepID=A0A3R6WFG2_9STRA|nr:hypothetical protein DYB32_009374 [Aphanomyces invadans]